MKFFLCWTKTQDTPNKTWFSQHRKISAVERFLFGGKSNENNLKGFQKQGIWTSDGKPCLVFMKDPHEVIQSQISNASSAIVIVKPIRAEFFSRAFICFVGTKACVVFIRAVKTNPHVRAIWKTKKANGDRWAVGCWQMFLVKSQVSLSAIPFAF